MKLLALGDLHLDAGADLGHKPGDRLAEQEAVWRWSLQQAREHEVDAVLFAGDAFQHRKPSVEALLAFERPLVEHAHEVGPRVLAVSGNHDVSSLDGGCALDVFHEAGLIELVREPRVVLVEGGARVCCLPWASTARLAANYDGPRDLLNEHAASLLVDVARDLYEEATRLLFPIDSPYGDGDPIILLTHFSISGTSLPSGLDVGQLREPVLPQDELLAIGYDAVIAGHIHRPALFGMRGMYVGSPMQLNFGESDGCTRGPWLVEFTGPSLGDLAPGVSASASFKQLPAPSRLFLNLDWPDDFQGEEPPDVDDAYVKVKAHLFERDAHIFDAVKLRAEIERWGAYRVFIEAHVERATRARDTSVDDSLDEREALARWLAAQNLEPDLHERVFERAVGYLDRVAAGDTDPERAASARPEPTVSDRQAATPEPAMPSLVPVGGLDA